MTECCPVHGPDPRGPLPFDVLVYADYGCHLWSNRAPDRFRDAHGALDPARLGISADLIANLEAWRLEWEDVKYGDDASDDWDDEWERRGWKLAQELQRQLGPGFNVQYQGYDGRDKRSVLDSAD